MNAQSKLYRTLQALLITGISILALATAHAADAPKVTANNYVRAESDLQMKLEQRGQIYFANHITPFHRSEMVVQQLTTVMAFFLCCFLVMALRVTATSSGKSTMATLSMI